MSDTLLMVLVVSVCGGGGDAILRVSLPSTLWMSFCRGMWGGVLSFLVRCRWLVLKNIEPWDPPHNVGKTKQRVGATKLDDQGHEALEGQYMLPGLDMDNLACLKRDSSSLDRYFSPGISN